MYTVMYIYSLSQIPSAIFNFRDVKLEEIEKWVPCMLGYGVTWVTFLDILLELEVERKAVA